MRKFYKGFTKEYMWFLHYKNMIDLSYEGQPCTLRGNKDMLKELVENKRPILIKSRSKEIGGTGLGLAIVKHIVDIHNAKISLESVPGEGTAVTILF